MKAAGPLFRFRLLIFILLYVLGFLPPWARYVGGGGGTLWLAASTLLARSTGVSLGSATLTVTVGALACLFAGSILRVWGTAHLGVGVMRSAALQGGGLVAAGPYRYVRNPLYLASYLQAVGVSILMPTSGAAFFLPAFGFFLLILIAAEERFLGGQQIETYEEYRRLVPRLIPGLIPGGPPRIRSREFAQATRPQWMSAVLAEIFPVSFTVCFAAFAWRYNARILIQCLLICYGVSLIIRAWMRPRY